MTPGTPPGPSVRAAGGVVTRRRNGDREFLVVHRPRYDDWSLPKGKVESGEKLSAAAVREIEEETGSKVKRRARLGSVAYNSLNASPKLVRYWLCEHESGKFRRNSEVDEVRWLTAAEADRLLTYPRDRKVFAWGAKLADSPRAGVVHLVRHAKAGSRASWKKKDGDDTRRPLTAAGRHQAALVAQWLTGTPVARIYASKYRRCVETLQPLATAIDERVRIEPALAEGAAVGRMLQLLGRLEGSAVAMATHGAEISRLLEALRAAGAHLDPIPAGLPDKAGMWELELTAGNVTTGRYLPPPS